MKLYYLLIPFILFSCNLGEYGILAYIETLNVSRDSNLPKTGSSASEVMVGSGVRYFVAMGRRLYWRNASDQNWKETKFEALALAEISPTQLAVASPSSLYFLHPETLKTQNYDASSFSQFINKIFYLAPNLYVHTGSVGSFSFYRIGPGGSALHGFSFPQLIPTVGNAIHITDSTQHGGNDYFLHNGVKPYYIGGTGEAFTTLPTDQKGFTGITSLGGTLYMSMGRNANRGNNIFANPDASAHNAGSFTSLNLKDKNYKFLTSGSVGGVSFLMAAVGDREIAFVNPSVGASTFSSYVIPASYLIGADSSNKLHRLLSYDQTNSRLFLSTDQNGLFSMNLSLTTSGTVSASDLKHE